jgi:hypothetical protein
MRWYSVKDYVVPRDCVLFLCCTEGNYYCGPYPEDNQWVLDDEFGIDKKIIKMTHFCIPEPVEREE